MLLVLFIVTSLINYADLIGEVDEVIRTQQSFYSMMVLCWVGAFTPSSWLPHAICRFVFMML